MPFQVLPVAESDIPFLIAIEFAAFAENPIAQFLRARDSSKAVHHARAFKRYSDMLLKSSKMVFRKVIDDSLDDPACASGDNRIIAWMRWEHIRPSQIWDRDPAHELDAWPFEIDPADQAMFREYWGGYEREKRKIMGRTEHCYLALIVVDPDHQRRGAATLLLQDFVRAVDTLGVAAYLDASPEGRGLYEKLGFVQKVESLFDLSQYPPHEGMRSHTVMVREPATEQMRKPP